MYTPLKALAELQDSGDEETFANRIMSQQQLVDSLKDTEDTLREDLAEIDQFWSSRQAKLKEELQRVRMDLLDAEQEVDQVMAGPPTGALSWVEGAWFNCMCTSVIILNVGIMVLEAQKPEWRGPTRVCDQIFLVWYCLELSLKASRFHQRLLIGRCSDVAWNWLDLLIVMGGVVDQWLKPAILALNGSENSNLGFNTSGLRALRLLRALRALRVGKLLHSTDWSWTEGSLFQSFIMAIVALNTVIMALELDWPWEGWTFVESALLAIYVFELVVRIKRWGLRFFVHESDWLWNYMDLLIVLGGVVDQWLLPLMYYFESSLGHPHRGANAATPVLKLIRIVRLVRILRLVRLLRAVGPLYGLLMGVLAAMQSIMWVMVLTFIILYAFAILATHLLGRGILFGGDEDAIPETIQSNFGTVLDSMFFLFKLMNDDQTVMNDVIHMLPAQILFVVFMVVSNWAILAILTSVMSEGMLTATQNEKSAKEVEEWRKKREDSVERLIAVFESLDKNEDSFVDFHEFQMLLQNAELRQELHEASGLRDRDLQELFMHLSHEDAEGKSKIRYEEFIEKLQMQGTVVSQRSVFRVEKLVRVMEGNIKMHIEGRLLDLMDKIGLPRPDEAELFESDTVWPTRLSTASR